ncbi:DUF2510 domain-containing protein [Leifsonia shinshuensis]|uniref:DUF2510 domain-containing protein n=1 Tax=Leifsonia shinshuensis TaxID=150026 RepID=UPI001F506989|nr:DUF2510 domain-containing protein [Leifsonia shinshuensis]MCI0158401.1 DUF2510 domain-containing protein [Leifsonia shinshuensis]
MSQLPPPGWYPDADSRYQRWWDGQRWTDSLQAVPLSAPVLVAPRNGLATAALAGGIAAASIAALEIVTAMGIDPLSLLLMVAAAAVALATGIPGLVRANRLDPHVGRSRAIWGIVLGAAAIVLVAAAVTLAMILTNGGATGTAA